MWTIQVPAPTGTQEPKGILIQQVFPPYGFNSENQQVEEILHALEEGLSQSALAELSKLLHEAHPA